MSTNPVDDELKTILDLYRRNTERHYGGRTVGKTLTSEEAYRRLLAWRAQATERAYNRGLRDGGENDTSSAGSMRRANMTVLEELQNMHIRDGKIVWIGGALNLVMPLTDRILMFKKVTKDYPKRLRTLTTLKGDSKS